jgi:hypothetical protein
LHLGSLDPGRLTAGARGPQGRLTWPGRPERPWPWRQRPGTKEGRRSGARGRRRRGPAGPGAHQEASGVLGLAREGRSAANFVAAAVRTCEGIGDGGGDSGRLGSIPRTGRARRRWWSFPAHRWRLVRRGTARLSGGHGGRAWLLGGGRGRRRASERGT